MTYDECLAKELISQSKFSPSIVEDNEEIARVVFSPKQILDGVVLPNAYYQIRNDGLSVLRLSYDFNKSLKRTIKDIETNEKKYAGYVCANVNFIRSILEQGFRLFYILDTSSKDKKAHADVWAIKPNDRLQIGKKGLNRLIDYEISRCFTKLILAS